MGILNLVALVFLLVAMSAAVVYVLRLRHANSSKAAYSRRRPLNSYEQTLYWRLVKTLPDYAVFAQMSLTRCVANPKTIANALANERLDFVVCDRTMKIVAAIEIEDESRPLSDRRRKSNDLKEGILAKAGIRLIRCSSKSLLSEAYIAMEFNNRTSLLMTQMAA